MVRQAPCTIAEYIYTVVLKELWTTQLVGHREEDTQADSSFDPRPARALMARAMPGLAQDVLQAVKGWIPAAAEIDPESLLPDLERFPRICDESDGLNITQRKLLFEALSIVLDVFNEPGANLPGVHGQLLPAASVASVAAQVAAALEHLTLVRPGCAAVPQNHGESVDFDALQKQGSATAVQRERSVPAPGSKEELIREVHRCRKRVFDLERDFAGQQKITEALTARGKRDLETTEKRLLSVNQALEERLKRRFEDFKEANERAYKLQHRVTHLEWLLQEKDKVAEELKQDNVRLGRKQSDLLLRERDYGKRVLELYVKETASIKRESLRVERLAGALEKIPKTFERTGTASSTGTMEEDFEACGRDALKRLTAEFDALFDERMQRFEQQTRHMTIFEEDADEEEQEDGAQPNLNRAVTAPRLGLRSTVGDSRNRRDAITCEASVQTDTQERRDPRDPRPTRAEAATSPTGAGQASQILPHLPQVPRTNSSQDGKRVLTPLRRHTAPTGQHLHLHSRASPETPQMRAVNELVGSEPVSSSQPAPDGSHQAASDGCRDEGAGAGMEPAATPETTPAPPQQQDCETV